MTTNRRDSTIDVAKGIAIVAIVAGHVWRGLGAAEIVAGDSAGFAAVDRSLYMFHLTVFAFTAGLFVQRKMRAIGAWRYALDCDLIFLWLYVLWSLISGGIKVLLSPVVNNPTSIREVFELWIPKEQFWFFGWIALMMIAAAAVQPWKSRSRAVVSFALLLGVSTVMWGTGGVFLGTQGLALAGFFWAALIVGAEHLTICLHRSPTWALTLAVAVGVSLMLGLTLTTSATTPTEGAVGRSTLNVALGVIASSSGLCAVIAMSSLLARFSSSTWLARLGQNSMAIYVAHVLFTAATRICLERLGLESAILHLVVGTIAGVVGPLAMAVAARKLHFNWMFDRPRWLDVLQRSRGEAERVPGRQGR